MAFDKIILLILLMFNCKVSFVVSMSDDEMMELSYPVKSFGEQCGYETCFDPIPNHLNIHVVPHTHLELGLDFNFQEHMDGYLPLGLRKTDSFNQIMYSLIPELSYVDRRMTISATSHFFDWWEKQSDEKKRDFLELLRRGKFNFVGGGWSMTDEANANYQAIIDHHTFAMRKLNKTFYKCGRPIVAWQAQSYGHSKEFASLMAQMGFDGLFISPISFYDEVQRMKNKSLEFVWRGNDHLGSETDIFTHKLFDGFSSPPGFCFSGLCSDPLIVTGDSHFENVLERAQVFLEDSQYRQWPNYRTNHIMVVMGGSRSYYDASRWFVNMDNLIEGVNRIRGEKRLPINMHYSTPACYLKAVNELRNPLPIKQDDFFPVSPTSTTTYVGHFTSRPNLKYMVTEANAYLQITKQLQVLANMPSQIKEVEDLKWIVGVMQDHNILSGAMVDQVLSYYTMRLHEAVQRSTVVIESGLNFLRGTPAYMYYRCALNESNCNIFELAYSSIVIYNPLAWPVTMPIRIPTLSNRAFVILNHEDELVPYSIMPLPEAVIPISDRNPEVESEIVFISRDIPPLGLRAYYMHMVHQDSITKREIKPEDEDADNYADDFERSQKEIREIRRQINPTDEHTEDEARDNKHKKENRGVRRHANPTNEDTEDDTRDYKHNKETRRIRYSEHDRRNIYQVTDAGVQAKDVEEDVTNTQVDEQFGEEFGLDVADVRSEDQSGEKTQKFENSTTRRPSTDSGPKEIWLKDMIPYSRKRTTMSPAQKKTAEREKLAETRRKANLLHNTDTVKYFEPLIPFYQDESFSLPINDTNDKDITKKRNEDTKATKDDKRISNNNNATDENVEEDTPLPDYESEGSGETSQRSSETIDEKQFPIEYEFSKGMEATTMIIEESGHIWKDKDLFNTDLANSSGLHILVDDLSALDGNATNTESPQNDKAKDDNSSAGVSLYEDYDGLDVDVNVDDTRRNHIKVKLPSLLRELPVFNKSDNFIKNKYITISMDPTTKMPIAITLANGVKVKLDIAVGFYEADYPTRRMADRRDPGVHNFASMFKLPRGYEPMRVFTYLSADVSELHIFFAPFATLALKLYRDMVYIEVDWILGEVPTPDDVGKEMFVRYRTDINNEGVFYTDANGRQTIKRIRGRYPSYQPEKYDEVAGNIYPVTSKIYIEDTKSDIRLSVFNDRPQGGSSFIDGSITLFINRKIQSFDENPPQIRLNENFPLRGKHYLYLSKRNKNKVFEKKFAKEIALMPRIFANLMTDMNEWYEKRRFYGNEFTTLSKRLPVGMHLLTLELLNRGQLLLRLENILENGDGASRQIVYMRNMFLDIRIKSLVEVTLAAAEFVGENPRKTWSTDVKFVKDFNKYYGNESRVEYSEIDVALPMAMADVDRGLAFKPQQIRTFIVEYEYAMRPNKV